MKFLILSVLLSFQAVCYSQTKQEIIDWILAKVNQGHLKHDPNWGIFRISIEININGDFKVYQKNYDNIFDAGYEKNRKYCN